jgi:formate-dependent phosphoribosylglycinamide formyltransferase (GAR transformylase)
MKKRKQKTVEQIVERNPKVFYQNKTLAALAENAAVEIRQGYSTAKRRTIILRALIKAARLERQARITDIRAFGKTLRDLRRQLSIAQANATSVEQAIYRERLMAHSSRGGSSFPS